MTDVGDVVRALSHRVDHLNVVLQTAFASEPPRQLTAVNANDAGQRRLRLSERLVDIKFLMDQRLSLLSGPLKATERKLGEIRLVVPLPYSDAAIVRADSGLGAVPRASQEKQDARKDLQQWSATAHDSYATSLMRIMLLTGTSVRRGHER